MNIEETIKKLESKCAYCNQRPSYRLLVGRLSRRRCIYLCEKHYNYYLDLKDFAMMQYLEAKEKLAQFLSWGRRKSPRFKEIKPEKPVPIDARPIIWLKTRIEQVRKKHPDSKIDWIENKGLLEKVVVHASQKEIGEVVKDVEQPAKWAFSTVLKEEQTKEMARESTAAFIREE
jgi:hypothetical protein